MMEMFENLFKIRGDILKLFIPMMNWSIEKDSLKQFKIKEVIVKIFAWPRNKTKDHNYIKNRIAKKNIFKHTLN